MVSTKKTLPTLIKTMSLTLTRNLSLSLPVYRSQREDQKPCKTCSTKFNNSINCGSALMGKLSWLLKSNLQLRKILTTKRHREKQNLLSAKTSAQVLQSWTRRRRKRKRFPQSRLTQLWLLRKSRRSSSRMNSKIGYTKWTSTVESVRKTTRESLWSEMSILEKALWWEC